ncbi:MAG: hypothetical protein ACOC11_03190 [Prolixibacteraceae bacterium]
MKRSRCDNLPISEERFVRLNDVVGQGIPCTGREPEFPTPAFKTGYPSGRL